MSWRAVDVAGIDLATGGEPCWPGYATPAAALAAAPVVAWPLAVVADDGRRLGVGRSLGPGGDRVEALLGSLAGTGPAGFDGTGPAGFDGTGPAGFEVVALAPSTPTGRVPLPVEVVGLHAGVEAAAGVDRSWLERVSAGRERARASLVAAGRGLELDAALNVTMLLATERLDPTDDRDVDAHVASGAQLWLLTGAVVSALSGVDPDPFAPWASLVAAGWWPVGPSGGRLVVAAGPGPARTPVATSGVEGSRGRR